MFKKLLVPIDGSEPSRAAARLAIALAKEQGASIAFCHALDTVALMQTAQNPAIDPSSAIAELKSKSAALLDEAVRDAQSVGVNATSKAGESDAVPYILARANEEEADLIVMGTHGRSGIAHAFLGSTAEGVLRSARVPVTVVTRH